MKELCLGYKNVVLSMVCFIVHVDETEAEARRTSFQHFTETTFPDGFSRDSFPTVREFSEANEMFSFLSIYRYGWIHLLKITFSFPFLSISDSFTFRENNIASEVRHGLPQ